MTSAQWLWEFEALAQKDRDDVERQLELFKLMRKQIVSILGLTLMCNKEDMEKDPDMFIPWVLMGGRREVVQSIFDKIEKEHVMKESIEDEEFEKLSSAIARGEIGDMDPILDISDLKLDEVKKKVRREDLQRAGVKIVDSVQNVPHIKFDKDAMLQKARAGLEDIQAARQQVNEELKTERKQAQGLSVLFDKEDA
jgi:hypothetical protein